MNVTQALR